MVPNICKQHITYPTNIPHPFDYKISHAKEPRNPQQIKRHRQSSGILFSFIFLFQINVRNIVLFPRNIQQQKLEYVPMYKYLSVCITYCPQKQTRQHIIGKIAHRYDNKTSTTTQFTILLRIYSFLSCQNYFFFYDL